MMNRKRVGAAILGALAVTMICGLPILAQEPATPKPVTAARKKQERTYAVPAHFGKIGLTEQQRASIHEVQAKRREKIEGLEKQIAEEKAAMLSECDAVLTDVQKKLLENLRAAAAAKNAPKSSEAPKGSN